MALQQIKERGALPMIDRGDIRQAIDRCSNIWASLPGAGYGQYEHKIGDLISKFKDAGGVVNEAGLLRLSSRHFSSLPLGRSSGLQSITTASIRHKSCGLIKRKVKLNIKGK